MSKYFYGVNYSIHPASGRIVLSEYREVNPCQVLVKVAGIEETDKHPIAGVAVEQAFQHILSMVGKDIERLICVHRVKGL